MAGKFLAFFVKWESAIDHSLPMTDFTRLSPFFPQVALLF